MLLIYKASAGSGKTFTLAYEYIKLLLGVKDPATGQYRLNRKQRDRHRGILAVTFTNKATDEMKQRIIHELAVLGEIEPGWKKPSPYIKDLCAELHCSPDELKPAAAKALRCLLFDFNFFNVSTIDSFFQIILRTFAREADIAGNYDVDLDNERAIGHGVRELFDSLVIDSDSPQTRRMLHWITQYLLGELASGRQISLFNRSSNVHDQFLHFIKSISNDVFATHFAEMMDYLSDPDRLQRFAQDISRVEQSILQTTRSLCSAAIAAIEDRGYTSGSLKIYHHLFNQLTRCARTGEETGTSATAMKVVTDPSVAYGKKLNEHLASHPDPQLEHAVADACRAIADGQARLQLLRTTRSNLFVLGLLERVYYHIDRYRADNNTIFLADTNSMLRDIIGDDEAPFVYERVGVWVRHFLIDEFQDTSRLQWENLRPLLKEGQATDDDSLIIGDEKQCIYRFRFSDPTLLQHQVQTEFAAESAPHPNNSDVSNNWRSSVEVVEFNNALFKAMAEITGFNEIYRNVCQKVPDGNRNHRGYIKIAGIDTPVDADFQTESLNILTADICRQIRDGYKASDICILTRFNTEAAAVISHLMQIADSTPELNGIRIISDDAMSVAAAPAVRLVLSIMRFMAIPETDEDDSTKSRGDHRREIAAMINRFQHLMSTGADLDSCLQGALTESKALADNDLGMIAGSMACFNVPSLVERIIAHYISPDVAEAQNMYLSAFVDVVTDFCSRGSADLQSFLSWWDDTGYRSRISAPFDEGAIRVMTVHKSKGLEFKCVHIPFVNWKMVDFRDREWFLTEGALDQVDPDLVPPMLPFRPAAYMDGTQFAGQYRRRLDEQRLDELNVAYVAFTRAIDELCLAYRATPSKPDTYMVNDLLAEALTRIPGLTQLPDPEPVPDPDSGRPEVTIRTIGSPTKATEEKKKPRTALQPDGSQPMIPYATAPRNDLWDKLDIDRYLDYGLARDRGILLHDVLAHVRHTDDLSRAIRLCTYRGRLPREMAQEVEAHLSRQLLRPDIAQWFEGYSRVLCERPLVLPDGEVRRPDRVVWTADGHIDIIDYKFGEQRPKAYSRQVRAYMDALAAMGYENLRGFIWYVDSGKTVPV